MKRKNNKGFTLAELLVVVAIIAVLVAISIPVFSSQLEKAREATDQANIRSAYAEVLSEVLTDDLDTNSKEIELVQKKDGWQTSVTTIGGIDVSGLAVKEGGTVVVAFDSSADIDEQVTITMK